MTNFNEKWAIGLTCSVFAALTLNINSGSVVGVADDNIYLGCGCHKTGSVYSICGVESNVKCRCRLGFGGRQCNRCRPGWQGFPRCRRFVDKRPDEHSQRNRKISSNETPYICSEGYQVDPVNGSCQPCRCPGGPGTDVQHADSCHVNKRGLQICDCYDGYTGRSCDRCSMNHYGSASMPGGQCKPCFCSGNIDVTVADSCDHVTGECTRCTNHTTGGDCEWCQLGYYGFAVLHNCQPCRCNPVGITWTALDGSAVCDTFTGLCHCMHDVTGQLCDECLPGFWDFGHGKENRGCRPCDCDVSGSMTSDCNQVDGQCNCKEGWNGRQCNMCADSYWGDPRKKCQRCQCNDLGSASDLCNSSTGQCYCLKNVTGRTCDLCVNGLTGNVPHCIPCGPCFDSWNVTLSTELAAEARVMLAERARFILRLGNSSANSFDNSLEKDIGEIYAIVSRNDELNQKRLMFASVLFHVRKVLTENEAAAETLLNRNKGRKVKATRDRLQRVVIRYADVTASYLRLKAVSKDLQGSNAFDRLKLTESYHNLTNELKRSTEIHRVADRRTHIIDSELARHVIKDFLDEFLSSYTSTLAKNERQLRLTSELVDNISLKVTRIFNGGRAQLQPSSVHNVSRELQAKSFQVRTVLREISTSSVQSNSEIAVELADIASEAVMSTAIVAMKMVLELDFCINGVEHLMAARTGHTHQVIDDTVKLSSNVQLPSLVENIVRDIDSMHVDQTIVDSVIGETRQALVDVAELLQDSVDVRSRSTAAKDWCMAVGQTVSAINLSYQLATRHAEAANSTSIHWMNSEPVIGFQFKTCRFVDPLIKLSSFNSG